MMHITVAICTYNGATRLPMVLERLRSQIVSLNLQWEVLVVDNASEDDTAAVVQRFQASNLEYPLRYCFEAKPGLGFARQRAVETAQGQWVGFLDDDNLPRNTWVQAAFDFANHHPNAGVCGSKVYGLFEADPPQNFERISRFLAIGGGSSPICYSAKHYKHYHRYVFPPGAGVVVHRRAWLQHVPPELSLQGRVSGLQLPGEDIEAFAYLREAGWEIWYNPTMEIDHVIPKERLEKTYLIKMMWGIGLSRFYTRTLTFKNWQKVLLTPLFWIHDCCKLCWHILHHVNSLTDLITTCEISLVLGSLASPFLFLRSRFSG
jgi:glycosyltransferase involved in cell wall biosynthesis